MAYTNVVGGSPVDVDVHGANLDQMDTNLSSLQRRAKQLFSTLDGAGTVVDKDFPADTFDNQILFAELDQVLPVGDVLLEAHLFLTAEPHALTGTFGYYVTSSPSGGFVYPADGNAEMFCDGQFDSSTYAAVNPSDPSVDSIPELDLALIPQDGTYVEAIWRTRVTDWGGGGGATGLTAGASFYYWMRMSSAQVGNVTVNVSPHSYWTIAQVV